MSETLSFAVDGPVGEITLTRPELLNRFDVALHRDFTELLLEVRGRRDLRALVLASTGRCFSAGEVLDLSMALEVGTMASDDLAEAIAAFKERREPKYQGR